MDIDKMAQEALKRINAHINKIAKRHLEQMKKQFAK